MDKKFENKIMSALRKLTKQWGPILKAKKETKIGPELHKCPLCEGIIYTGKRSIDIIKVSYPEAIVGRMDTDHINPVIDIEDSGKGKDWNKIINRMFCSEDNIQNICSTCHSHKTKQERELRTAKRKINKNL